MRKIVFLLLAIIPLSPAFAIPGPNAYSAAELKAIAEIPNFPAWGEPYSLERTTPGGYTGGEMHYLLRSKFLDGDVCFAIIVRSQLGHAVGGSWNEVVAEVVDVTELENCPAE